MKVWTRQDNRIVEIIENCGVYRCRGEYIDKKMDDFSDYYKKLYSWYTKRAERIVEKPEGVEFPIWVSIDEEMQLQPVEDTVIIELEVDERDVVITDMEKWGYIVNFFYVPLDEEDYGRHIKELDRYGIGDESALIMSGKGNFYPLLKQKIESSWDRLFEDYRLSDIRQGTIWEIKKEWITRIIGGEER